jgi:hypothetical protein
VAEPVPDHVEDIFQNTHLKICQFHGLPPSSRSV